MAWSLAGVTIYCDEDTDDQAEPIYGQIQILNATTTTLHYAGAKSRWRSIAFWLRGDANKGTLETAAETNANVNLTSDQGSQGNYRIMKFTPKRIHATNDAQPWFRCTADLMKR